MSMTPSQRLLDEKLPGGLDRYVTGRRDRGDSWESIAQDIRADTDREIAITSNTLRRWYLPLPVA